MKFLLDTDLVIWWLTDDDCLPRLAREIVEDENNEIMVSVVSLFEIADRVGNKILCANVNDMETALTAEGITILTLTPQHCAHMATLEPTADVYDRSLVAQSQVEQILFLTTEPALTQFGRSVVNV
ncbi:MAG: type II toxin-antitoxin system VapC family toxin [Armatimonadota bacterium]